MFDFDLSELYQVETRVLNQAVKRNVNRFPEDFMFRLSVDEWTSISSQFVMTSRTKRPKSALPLKNMGTEKVIIFSVPNDYTARSPQSL